MLTNKKVFFFLLILLNITFSISNMCFAQRELNIYSWSNYTHPEIIKEFEKKYQVKVNYDVFDSNYLLESKISIGSNGYDVVLPSNAPFLMRQIEFGIYEKLDLNNIPNYKNLDNVILKLIDKQKKVLEYSVPYLWGTTGIGYNVKAAKNINTKHAMDSLANIFEVENIKQFAPCGVEILDSPLEVISMLLIYYGKNPDAQSLDDLEFASKKLHAIRPYIRGINSSAYIDNLANNDACLVLGFSGDVLQARNRAKEANNGVEIIYVRPKEVFEVGVDSLAILQTSKNKDLAYKFINFLLQPEVMAKISDYTGYANANRASWPLIDKKLFNDKSIFFDISSSKNIYMLNLLSPEYNKAAMKVWLKFISDV
jgi:putrescine transport system substrate-binding protein